VRARIVVAVVALVTVVGASCSSGSGAAHANDPAFTGPRTPVGRTLEAGGRTRAYTVLLPRTHVAHPPLVVVLHVLGGTGGNVEPTSPVARAAWRAGAVVAAPEGIGFSWNAGSCCDPARRRHVDDVGFLRAVIRDAVRRDRVDPKRVVAIGFSNGGFLAYRAACEGVRFAGIAVVEGTMTVDRCASARPMDLIAIHQTGDPVVPYAGAVEPVVEGAIAPFPPVRTSFSRWLEAQHCDPQLRTSTRTSVTTLTTTCRAGTRAELEVMVGGQHVWPTPPAAPVDATADVLAFLGIARR
jgi:polyhydroxybutyrate depolymerase